MAPLFDLDLLDALEASVKDRWESPAWRQVVADSDPVHSNQYEARWNPAGVEVLYTALSAEGAEAELSAVLDRQPVPITKARSLHRLSVRLTNVGVVSDSAAYENAGVTATAVIQDDWSLSQRLGAAANWLGFAGLVVPSARHDDGNLVVFVNNLASGDHCRLEPD